MDKPNEITREEMVEWMDFWVKQYKFDYEAIRYVHPNPTAEAIIYSKKQYAIVKAIRKELEKPTGDDDIPHGYFQVKVPIWVLVKMDFFKRLKKMGYEVDMKKTNQYIANSMVDNSEVSRRTSDKEGER